ncbi:iron complex outermembrane receptor protein [Leeuwenhoekiella aestuarii]|uniref:Iron complex outermembrane receptor protein n=2 Tax=Leeuwenhoekiella aestuarii TaxID=2249426 RepID=A0A4Q0NQZ7_9FLAO|nr:iron complex outermembrane receptor protein [Leeuwenhoekiella aestuarii]RXG13543.1 iron complex outermembrane receptor protein [Leeuwenhoekiella aestuarii]
MKNHGRNLVLLKQELGKKMNFKMKISLVLTFFALFQLSANTVLSQDKIEFDVKEVQLQKVLDEIESQSDYSFFYNVNEIDVARKISYSAKKENIENVLKNLSDIAHFNFVFNGKQIVLTKKEQFSSNPVSMQSVVNGVVKDDGGYPLPGANILVKGTTIGATTDFDGNFTIEVPADKNILVISYVGFKTTEVDITGKNTIDIQLEAAAAQLDDVVLVGSRGKPRTDVNRPVPVDVVEAKELALTGQTDLGQQIQFSSPSFNSAKYGVNGTTNYAEPATLKGMSPDQSLVLINGKRRHQFSTLNLNVSPGLGTIVTDINSIPSGALSRIEVLRDGGAAQYGSDAISGIINLNLNKSVGEGTYIGTAGIHKEGDGVTFKHSINYGFGLGKEGSYLNTTLEMFTFSGTNRSDTYTGRIYPVTPDDYDQTGPTPDFPYDTANPREDRGYYPQGDVVVGNYGSNENDTYQAFYNAGLPIGTKDWKLYSFGGVSRKDILAYGFFRAPSNFGNSALGIFPDGFVPELPGSSVDVSTVVGVDRVTREGWNYDLSLSYGRNYLDLFANNTVNPSMGTASPTEFKVGRYDFRQTIGEFNMSKALSETFNLAFGTQYRTDRFLLKQGSPESFEVGPLATEGKAIGSSARPGIADIDENDLSRSNFAMYVDVEKDFSEKLLVAAAVRYENYSDFGGNLSGKLAGRYKLTENLALRGSYNRGFRAPSVAQIGNRVNTSTVQNDVIVITKQVSSDDPRLAQLGVKDPEAEISNNYNVGVTAKLLGGKLLFTADAFRIDINDRIVITERLDTGDFPAVAALFPEASEIRFFTNAISTKTTGVDIVAAYKERFSEKSNFSGSLALTLNQTEVVSQQAAPAELTAGGDPDFKLLGEVATQLIEVAQPRYKLLASLNYNTGRFGFIGRMTHFGEVQAASGGLSLEDPNVIESDSGDRLVQVFSDKALVDLSISFRFSDNFTWSIGSNNIFDTYPDKWNNTRDGAIGQASNYSSGQIPYSRNSNQFGFNGAYYYTSLNINF